MTDHQRPLFTRFLLATSLCVTAATAQIPQAVYPLTTDLLDATNTYGPVALQSQTGTPPANPTPEDGVCVNGIYYYNANGQDVRTATVSTLDDTDFELRVEFRVTQFGSFNMPVWIGGNLYRWIGFYLQPNGTFGLLHNNSQYEWSAATVTAGRWYSGVIRYEGGAVELFLDGALVHTATIGPLNTASDFDFTTNNFSNGTNFNGCVRNVVIANDATLGQTSIATATNHGAGCDGLTMAADGLPTLGNLAFALDIDGVSTTTPLVFTAFGFGLTSPGIDLTGAGMPGCFAYTNADQGIFGPEVATNGMVSVALPIPNVPVLEGALIVAQAIGVTTATPLGLSSSNGTALILGN